MYRILIVEDENDLADLIGYNLRKAGYHAESMSEGAAVLQRVLQSAPDLIILDVMLPGLSGIQIARQLRTNTKTSTTPILMLTAKGEELDQLSGLQAGADDYVTKPFSMKVLMARVDALIRRAQSPSDQSKDELQVDQIRADTSTHEAWVGQTPVKLTLTEFRILVALLRKPGKVVSRADLMYAAMGPDVLVTARTIDVHVAAIRKKLGDTGAMIRTVRGVGYTLGPERSGRGSEPARLNPARTTD